MYYIVLSISVSLSISIYIYIHGCFKHRGARDRHQQRPRACRMCSWNWRSWSRGRWVCLNRETKMNSSSLYIYIYLYYIHIYIYTYIIIVDYHRVQFSVPLSLGVPDFGQTQPPLTGNISTEAANRIGGEAPRVALLPRIGVMLQAHSQFKQHFSIEQIQFYHEHVIVFVPCQSGQVFQIGPSRCFGQHMFFSVPGASTKRLWCQTDGVGCLCQVLHQAKIAAHLMGQCPLSHQGPSLEYPDTTFDQRKEVSSGWARNSEFFTVVFSPRIRFVYLVLNTCGYDTSKNYIYPSKLR